MDDPLVSSQDVCYSLYTDSCIAVHICKQCRESPTCRESATCRESPTCRESATFRESPTCRESATRLLSCTSVQL